jgi:hypothetical protein
MEDGSATPESDNVLVTVPIAEGTVNDPGLLSEGAASGIVVLGAFCNEAYGLPARDLTVAALRAFADIENCGPRTLVCIDALAGCGLRALRLALEVGRVVPFPSCPRCTAPHRLDRNRHHRMPSTAGAANSLQRFLYAWPNTAEIRPAPRRSRAFAFPPHAR